MLILGKRIEEMKQKEEYDVRMEGVIECLTPLSHIGETYSIVSLFNRDEIQNQHGKWVKVPTYSGNALRGMFRRDIRDFFCENIGCTLNAEWLAKLSFGGGIGETTIFDTTNRGIERMFFPQLSLFGWGLGNMLGKISPSPARLICEDTAHLVPDKYLKGISLYSPRAHLEIQSFSRMDDFKKDTVVTKLLDTSSVELDNKGKRKLAQGESSSQMRYRVQVLKTGSKLYCRFDFRDVNAIEIGCFVTSLHSWAKHSSRLGGMHNKGFGLVKLNLDYTNTTTNEIVEDFILTNSSTLSLSQNAEDFVKEYYTYIKEVMIPLEEKYKGFLNDTKVDIIKMLNL